MAASLIVSHVPNESKSNDLEVLVNTTGKGSTGLFVLLLFVFVYQGVQ